MSGEQIVTICVAAISGVSGIVGILIGVFLQPMLEKKKSKNEFRVYVSKTRYDLENKLYEELRPILKNVKNAIDFFQTTAEHLINTNRYVDIENYSKVDVYSHYTRLREFIDENRYTLPNDLIITLIEFRISTFSCIGCIEQLKSISAEVIPSLEEFKSKADEFRYSFHYVQTAISNRLSDLSIVK